LSLVSLISRCCLYIWPRNDEWKGEDGLEDEEDEGLGAACPNPKMVSKDRRGECRLLCPGDCDKVIEHELVEFWWEEGRERMTLCKALGERLLDILRSNFGTSVRFSPRNLEGMILLLSSLCHFSSFLVRKASLFPSSNLSLFSSQFQQ
jgi:hypothetical protein